MPNQIARSPATANVSPVALNQYTLVNRTHTHFIYMLQGPTNISPYRQHVKYRCNLMNIFHNFAFIFGGSGEAHVESRGTKVS